jgi:hypothetical protein
MGEPDTIELWIDRQKNLYFHIPASAQTFEAVCGEELDGLPDDAILIDNYNLDELIEEDKQRDEPGNQLCPICKIYVDESESSAPYRRTKNYKENKYPGWAYYSDFTEHANRWHSLPPSLAKIFIAVAELIVKYSETKTP